MNNVFSVNRTTTGSVFDARARVKTISFVTTATAGSLTFRNGGPTGDILLKIDTPAVAFLNSIDMPDSGIVFASGVHVTLSNVSSVTTIMG